MPSFITDYLYNGGQTTPGHYGSPFWALVYILLVFGGVSLAVVCMNWLERKILAHMQIRLGPMRVGPHGLLQPIADAIKLILQEDIIPEGADRFVFWLAPMSILLAVFSVYTVVPFGPAHAITDMNIGILFMLGVSSLGVLGIVMAGWASNSHYPLIGALRSSAQMVSYEVAMGLAVVSAVLMTSLNAEGTGTLSMIGIVQAQYAQHTWFVFKFFPLGLIAFFIFAVAMVAETNRAPFDLPEAESELTAGFHTEYSGLRWSLFMLGEYAAMIAVSSIAVTLWLGGWMRPFPNLLSGPTWDLAFSLFPALTFFGLSVMTFYSTMRMPKHSYFRIQTMGLGAFGAVFVLIALILLVPAVRVRVQDIYWFILKIAVFMYLYIWYRGTFPRYRFDQLMKVGWKILLPMGIGVLMLTAVIGLRAEIWGFASLLSGLAILSGVLVITRKSPVHSALALILTLLCLAGLYLMLYAPFVAGVQIILYVGGIMVLFLFVIMLVNLERSQKEKQFNQQWIAGLLAAICLGGLFVSIYTVSGLRLRTQIQFPEVENTQKVGEMLYSNYMFPFEIASLLLLVAIIGAVVMAKKRI